MITNEDFEDRPASHAHLPLPERVWVADWRDFVVVNFAVPPAVLAPHVPYPLDTFAGQAWVSLVWFNLKRLRFAGTGFVGRWLCRPLSDHAFLNVRTYVRPPDGPGICFLAEWIPNRFNALLGPVTYGLPYRWGRFTTDRRPLQGTMTLRIEDPGQAQPFGLTVPIPHPTETRCAPGSVDEFLLERYQAYMFLESGPRRFLVAHAPWAAERADWVRIDLGFLRALFPWFEEATFHSAHLSPGCNDVEMGRPHRVPRAAGLTTPTHHRIPPLAVPLP